MEAHEGQRNADTESLSSRRPEKERHRQLERASNGRARSRTRTSIHVRALIAAIQGEPATGSNDERGHQAQVGASQARLASDEQRTASAQTASEWRADCCRALLRAARATGDDGRSSAATATEGMVARTQLGSRPGRRGAGGPQAADPMLTHALLVTGPVTWCRACGAYADARVRSLRCRCAGPPAGPGGSGRTSLRNILAGRHPLSGEHLGATARSRR